MCYPRKIVYFFVLAFIVLLDITTKAIAHKYFDHAIVLNDNIAFSVDLSGLELTLTILVTIILVYLLISNKLPSKYGIPISMIIGGGIGNVVDRLADGYISDFIHFGQFPVFNTSDIFISVGIAIVLYRTLVKND